MKISLRKANVLQASINEAIKNLKLEYTIKVNEFENAEQKIEKARDEFMRDLFRRSDLNDVLFEIRMLVAEANAANGINSRLARVAKIERRISNYGELVNASVRTDEAVLAGKLEKIRNRKDESRIYGYEADVMTSVFSASDLAIFKDGLSEAKKQKQKLQDELLEANVQTTIELSGEVVAVLQKENLI